MTKKGKLFIISAPSGAGKTTLCEKLIKSLPGVVRSVSMTTRKRRAGELNGRDYFFVSKAEFEKKLKKKKFLEYAKVFGNYYGTPRDFVEKKLNKKKDVLLTIDVQGALKVKKTFGKNSIFIFLLPPSLKDLRRRLLKRKTNTKKEINERLRVSRRELKYLKYYDFKVINRDIKKALEQLKAIFIADRCRINKTK